MTSYFTTTGMIADDAASLYVSRTCDTEFNQALEQGYFITLLGPRRSGKTNLLARKYRALKATRTYLPIYIYMEHMARARTEAEWYASFWNEFVRGARGLLQPHPVPEDDTEWRDTLLTVLEEDLPNRILVFLLDDVDKIREPYLTPFMTTIREMFTTRGVSPAFNRVIFVLAGCFLPEDLIQDRSVSPFTVAKPIYIQDAGLEEIKPLIERLTQSGHTVLPSIIQEIYGWLEGDPYLTQALCTHLEALSDLTPHTVDLVARKQLPQDNLFVSMRHKLEVKPYLLDLIGSLVRPDAVPRPFAITARDIAEAWLGGTIKADSNGNCVIRNQVVHNALHLLFPNAVPEPVLDTTSAMPPARQTHALHGGQYVLHKQIGRGQMGKVYLGKDRDGRDIAVKQLSVEADSSPEYQRYLDRFLREGRALRQLNHHANIVAFIDHFVEDNDAYIVMEYVPGGSLKDLINRLNQDNQPFPFDLSFRMMGGLAAALEHAHSHQIIHRDVKPQNILLTENFVPRLADFGIARILSEHSLTTEGQFLGSLRYSSPEAINDSKTVTEQSDLWSLGVVLFEILSGIQLIQGTSYTGICKSILFEPLPAIRDMRPDTPDALADLLDWLLARDLGARCKSAHELGLHLSRLAL